MTQTIQDSVVVTGYRKELLKMLEARYHGKYSRRDLEKKVDKIIDEKLKNPKVTVFNNYTNVAVRTDVVSLTDAIDKNHLIISGGGTLFKPHGSSDNVLIAFILEIMGKRDGAKAERKKYPKGSDEWLQWDIAQLLYKLVINSLYGCMGYPGFTLFSLFTAEAITATGRHIITTAINCLEGFLGDAMYFMDINEAMHFLYNIKSEAEDLGRFLDMSIFGDKDWRTMARNRFLSRCKWNLTDAQLAAIDEMFASMGTNEAIMVYYKNNFMEFNRLPFILKKFQYIIEHNGSLPFCQRKLLNQSDPMILQMVDEIWKFYQIFVLYDYPVHDRLRKAMYIPKSRCLYTDTDSVFISMSHFVNYIRRDVCNNRIPEIYESYQDLRFTAVNLVLIFLNDVIQKALNGLCSSTNVEDDWAPYLYMKNEFYLEKICFVEKKKRYASLSILQEGQLLKDKDTGQIGLPELKGFDFLKSVTKPYLKQFYTDLATDEILRTAEISPSRIFSKLVKLKNDIQFGIRNGDTKYFKQSKVKMIEDYKNPYSTQGVTAIMLWNALVPEQEMQFPVDVNIVPIKSLKMAKPKDPPAGAPINQRVDMGDPLKNRNVAAFAEKWPEAYQQLYREIYRNPVPEIRYMSLSSIALPKNSNIRIPDYIYDLVDYESIVDSSLQLFLPLADSIGLRSLPTTSNTTHMSNLIDL